MNKPILFVVLLGAWLNGWAPNKKEALRYNSRAITFYSALKDSSGIAVILSNMANVYYRLDQLDSVYDVDKYNELTRARLNYEYGKREDSIQYQKQVADVKLAEENDLAAVSRCSGELE